MGAKRGGVQSRIASKATALAISLAFVGSAAIARAVLLSGATTTAPFLLFYPAMGLSAYFGGLSIGFVSMALAACIVPAFYPNPPAVANWIWFCLLGPAVVLSSARIKRLRDRSIALAEESLRLRYIMNRVSDWIFLTDESGVIEYANETPRLQLVGASEQLVGRRIQDFALPADQSTLRDLIASCGEDGGPLAEISFSRQERTPVLVEIRCSAIAADNRRVVHVSGRDVTERRGIERKLRAARQWESLGALAGGVAHDFNNLLTSIMGYASLARESLGEGHPSGPLIGSIEHASERAADLVRLMLASSGYRSRYCEPLLLQEILSGLLSKHQLPGNGLVNVSAEPCVVESDVRSMETLLWSIIANAAESYGEGSGQVEISIRVVAKQGSDNGVAPSFEEGEHPADHCVEIAVEDRGSGMTTEVLERAFDPFYSTKFTGRGLGLPAVRGIVRAHNGRLRLKTAPGQGTRIEILLPGAN
jgi:PAS domain S-box-containing protein